MTNRIFFAGAALALAVCITPTGVLAATAATGSFDSATLTTTSVKPTITGDASGTKKIRVLIENDEGKDLFKSRSTTVKKTGDWKVKVSKTLPVGNYQVTVYGSQGLKKGKLATGTLTILPKGASTATTGSSSSSSASSASGKGPLVVSMIPLLMGGSAAHGATIPVAYIKVSNTGTATTAIEGFTLKETGSAPDALVIGFATSDDKGGSRTTVGGAEGSLQFKNGIATVPLVATLAPGEFRIFTIKAILSKDSGTAYGKQLMIDVNSVLTKAAVKGTFPIRGTTFTLSY